MGWRPGRERGAIYPWCSHRPGPNIVHGELPCTATMVPTKSPSPSVSSLRKPPNSSVPSVASGLVWHYQGLYFNYHVTSPTQQFRFIRENSTLMTMGMLSRRLWSLPHYCWDSPYKVCPHRRSRKLKGQCVTIATYEPDNIPIVMMLSSPRAKYALVSILDFFCGDLVRRIPAVAEGSRA